ncbi:phosphatidylinositol/phosphatidylcholine transfer protein SFH6-like protein [Tanacetum coccineum]
MNFAIPDIEQLDTLSLTAEKWPNRHLDSNKTNNFRRESTFGERTANKKNQTLMPSFRQEDKWWLSYPRVPASGLSEDVRKRLHCIVEVQAAYKIGAHVISSNSIEQAIFKFCTPQIKKVPPRPVSFGWIGIVHVEILGQAEPKKLMKVTTIERYVKYYVHEYERSLAIRFQSALFLQLPLQTVLQQMERKL